VPRCKRTRCMHARGGGRGGRTGLCITSGDVVASELLVVLDPGGLTGGVLAAARYRAPPAPALLTVDAADDVEGSL
jgi:hypothetical protein